jgi:hypothetical protein
MAAYSGRKETGLWDGGFVTSKKAAEFNDYAVTTVNTKRYFNVNTNRYGYTAANSPLLEIDTSKHWQFGASTYTYQLSYNNRTASGHMGIRQYDSRGNLSYYYMCGNFGPTTLSRQANPGDTTIYLTNNSGWYTGTSAGSDLAVFFPASHPYYSRPYYYSRLVARYDGPSFSLTAHGDYSVNLDAGLPNWGYSLPAGTPIGNGRGTNANLYNITSNTNYDNFQKWRTFTSSVYHGERIDGGNFINDTRYVRFLHLVNYTYRTETAGDSARYYIANIMAVRCKNGIARPTKLFQRKLPGPFY